MSNESLTLRSRIDPKLTQATLFRGILFAALGAAVLFYTGTQWNTEQLAQWGWGAFLLSLILITLGLYPYRKLTQLELTPYELKITSDELAFSKKGTCYFIVPLSLIQEVQHYSNGSTYGITAQLAESASTQIRVLEVDFDMARYLKRNQHRLNADLFFPFFSARAANELADCLGFDSES